MKGKISAGEMAEKLYHFSNVEHLSDAQAKARAIPFGRQTEFDNINFESSVRNRSAGVTVYVGSDAVAQKQLSSRQNQILKALPDTLRRISRYLDRAPMICVERTMGDNADFAPHCTLYVSTYRKECARLAYMWGETLFPYSPTLAGPDLNLIYIPEWPEAERQILVFPEEGVTFVLGSDYMGEAKKGFLRMAMWFAKQEEMLGVHAGAKIIQARNSAGKLRSHSMLLFGLSATGKTTHSCHTHGLDHEGEEMLVVQDDICFLKADGSALGTERGFYLKTDGLDPHTQPLLYHAATQPDTIFENVMVDWQGRVDFQDETISTNGRGVVQMANLAPHASGSINLPPLGELDALLLVFITRRNTVMPMISKLNAEQAALAFMLGESVESSAGDPTKAGQSVRVVGTNPFIVGDEAAEGNWMYDFIKSHENKVQAYIVNTGGVGEIYERKLDGSKTIKREVNRIQIPETSSLFRAIVRNEIEWVKEPFFGSLVPRKVEGMDLHKYDPVAHYSTELLTEYVNRLKQERKEYLEQFSGLNPNIVEACKV